MSKGIGFHIMYYIEWGILRGGGGGGHRWDFPGNYPVFTVVMVIYCYVERVV